VLGRAPAEVAARRVHLHDQVAYVLSSNLEEGVEVFDISKPAEPKRLGRIRQEGVYDMAFEGANGWLSIAQGGVAKVNLADLSAPPVTMAPLGVFPESIRLFGGKLYVADESLADLRVYNASSGALDESIVTGESVDFVHVDGTSLATAGRAGVRTFSVRGSGTLEPLGFLRVEERIWMSVRKGDHLFLNAGPGLIVADIGNPAEPREVFRGPAGAATNGWTWWYSARIEGSRLHYSNMEGLTVLDISNPAAPFVISQGPGGSMSMFQAGDYIYNGRPNAGFDVVHAADPHAAPLRQVPLFASEYLFARSGDLLVVAVNYISGASSGGLVFYDISDPSNPALIGYGPGFQPAQSMVVENDRLFVLTYSRLRIFDLSEVPRAAGLEPVNVPVPLLAYHYDLEKAFMQGAMSGNTLYVAEGQRGVSLWRVEPLVKIHASREEDGKVRLSFTGSGPGYELLRAPHPAGPWQAAEVTTNSTFDIFAGGAAGFFQVRSVH
jgi:hypothetical protein